MTTKKCPVCGSKYIAIRPIKTEEDVCVDCKVMHMAIYSGFDDDILSELSYRLRHCEYKWVKVGSSFQYVMVIPVTNQRGKKVYMDIETECLYNESDVIDNISPKEESDFFALAKQSFGFPAYRIAEHDPLLTHMNTVQENILIETHHALNKSIEQMTEDEFKIFFKYGMKELFFMDLLRACSYRLGICNIFEGKQLNRCI